MIKTVLVGSVLYYLYLHNLKVAMDLYSFWEVIN